MEGVSLRILPGEAVCRYSREPEADIIEGLQSEKARMCWEEPSGTRRQNRRISEYAEGRLGYEPQNPPWWVCEDPAVELSRDSGLSVGSHPQVPGKEADKGDLWSYWFLLGFPHCGIMNCVILGLT